VVYDGREIGSTDAIAEKLSQLQLSRSTDDPHYVIFVGVVSGECLLTAFPTMGDPVEFRGRRQLGAFPASAKALEKAEEGSLAQVVFFDLIRLKAWKWYAVIAQWAGYVGSRRCCTRRQAGAGSAKLSVWEDLADSEVNGFYQEWNASDARGISSGVTVWALLQA
jgi:hypothetical protein